MTTRTTIIATLAAVHFIIVYSKVANNLIRKS